MMSQKWRAASQQVSGVAGTMHKMWVWSGLFVIVVVLLLLLLVVLCVSFVRSGWLFWCCRRSQQEVVERQERHAASQVALQVGVPMCGLAGIILVW